MEEREQARRATETRKDDNMARGGKVERKAGRRPCWWRLKVERFKNDWTVVLLGRNEQYDGAMIGSWLDD